MPVIRVHRQLRRDTVTGGRVAPADSRRPRRAWGRAADSERAEGASRRTQPTQRSSSRRPGPAGREPRGRLGTDQGRRQVDSDTKVPSRRLVSEPDTQREMRTAKSALAHQRTSTHFTAKARTPTTPFCVRRRSVDTDDARHAFRTRNSSPRGAAAARDARPFHAAPAPRTGVPPPGGLARSPDSRGRRPRLRRPPPSPDGLDWPSLRVVAPSRRSESSLRVRRRSESPLRRSESPLRVNRRSESSPVA